MIDLKNIENGLEFGRKAEEALRRSGETNGMEIISEGYRKTITDLLIEVRKHQPNPDLTYERLYKLCNQHNWFTHGDVSQYNDLFEARDNGATTHDLAVMIWICSDHAEWTIESIQKILDEKMYAAVLHGDIYYISDYESVEKYLAEESDDNPDWEICEFSGRIREVI